MTEVNNETNLDYKRYFNQAISYDQYLRNFQNEIAEGGDSEYAQYLPQNWQRQSRLDRKLKLSEILISALDNLDRQLNWLVITEHWCGDASQIIPIINKAADKSNGKIDLRFIYRDENLELIDAHLTDGRSRSIPILIQLDSDHNYISSYGPRPAEAQKLVMSLLSRQEPYSIPLHTWYAKDKQQSIQNDIAEKISEI